MITEILRLNASAYKKIVRNYLPSEPAKTDSRVLSTLIWRILKCGGKFVAVEERYIDRDFSEDYAAFHFGVFKNKGKETVRLHFFSDINLTHASDLPLGPKSKKRTLANAKRANADYLGFIVILPLSQGIIGRTVIRHDGHDAEYCATITSHDVHIDGVELSVDGMPFIQQDGQVGVCASAAAWMVSRYMQLQFRFPRFSLSRITSAANKAFQINRPFPAIRGLTIEQIVSGFVELGYTPLHYRKSQVLDDPLYIDNEVDEKGWWPHKEIIYKYIESGLPVIAVIDNSHACVIAGHKFAASKFLDSDEPITSSSHFIDSFVVHDDEWGPYLLLPEFLKVSKQTSPEYFNSGIDPFSQRPNRYTNYSIQNITSLIIPTFSKLYLEATQVELLLRHVLTNEDSRYRQAYGVFVEWSLDENPSIFLKKTREHIRRFCRRFIHRKGPVYYRSLFALNVNLKNDFLFNKPGIDSTLSVKYSQMDMSRYVWLVEFGLDPIHTCGYNGRSSRIVGELLLDATGGEQPDSIISVHLPGFLFVNRKYEDKALRREDSDLEEGQIVAYVLEKDRPYPPYDRRKYV